MYLLKKSNGEKNGEKKNLTIKTTGKMTSLANSTKCLRQN